VSEPDSEPFAPAVARARTLREQVLAVCYESLVRGVNEASVLEERRGAYAGFVTERVAGIAQSKDRIDALIRAWSIGWDLERITPIDRTVLRLGVYELLAHPELPTAVVIAEAVRLADRFSTAESGRFVHGILAGIARTTREDAVRP
jgi:N utilization substance protein B